jgi:hypothetical protein
MDAISVVSIAMEPVIGHPPGCVGPEAAKTSLKPSEAPAARQLQLYGKKDEATRPGCKPGARRGGFRKPLHP